MNSSPASEKATRERLLDTAEDLFNTRSFDKVSIRAINARAGVHLAATHYYFGSKEALVEAVIARRLERFDRWRREQLDALRDRDEPPSPCEIIDVMARPLVELLRREPEKGQGWVSLLARLFLSQTRRGWTREWQSVDYALWEQVLRRAFPDLPLPVLKARWLLAVEVVLVAIGKPLAHGSEEVSLEWRPLPPLEHAEVIIGFAVTGLCNGEVGGGGGLSADRLATLADYV